MKIDNTFIETCENLIGKGKTNAVIEQLQSVKDQTGYKKELIHLESRWKKFSRDKMSGTLSSESESLQNSKINKDILLLIEALKRELSGESVVSDLFQLHSQNGTTWRPLTQTYIPIILTALAIWAVSFFAYKKPAPTCEHELNLDGSWEIYSYFNDQKDKVGRANIIQHPCELHFQISGALKTPSDPDKEVDFSSSIAGFDNGKVIFVYENFEGERGVCRGIEPSTSSDEFTVHCTDIVGYDKDGSTKGTLKFKRKL